MSPTTQQLADLAQALLNRTTAENAEVSVSWRKAGYVRFANNEVSQTGVVSGHSLHAAASFGQRHGGAEGNQTDAQSLNEVAQRAVAAARNAAPDEEHLPPVEPPQDYLNPPAYFETTVRWTPADRAEAVAEIVRVAKAAGLRAAGSVHTREAASAFANSAGLSEAHQTTSAETVVTMVGEGFSGWASADAHDVEQIDFRAVAEEARDYALAARNPEDLAPGRYTTVLAPQAVQGLLGPLVWRLDARAADEGRSALSGGEGQQIAAESFSLRSDPEHPLAPGARRDSEGHALRATTYVDRGVLQPLPCTRYWSQKQSRALIHFPANVLVDGGEGSVGDLLAGVKDGLLVTRVWYVRDVDPMRLLLTGMTRDALLRIRDGQVVGAVKHFRWNNSPLDLLSNLIALGAPRRVNGQLLPPMTVGDFYFTSPTQF